MSVTALLEVQLKPDAVDDGIAALNAVLVDTRAFEGNEGVLVIQDKDDPARLVAVETWESLEADAKYREWRAGEGAPTAMVPFLAGAPRLIVGRQLEV
jgi:quinol monooxygenase YgiN